MNFSDLPIELIGIIVNCSDSITNYMFGETCHQLRALRKTRIFSITEAVNHLNILQWARDYNYYIEPERLYPVAVLRGDLDVIKWLHQYYPLTNSFIPCNNAALRGDLDVFKWLYHNEYPINNETYLNAAKAGSIGILELLDDNDISSDCPCESASDNVLATLQYAIRTRHIDNCCPDRNIINPNIARSGNLDALKWLRSELKTDKHYHINNKWCSNAAGGGHLDVLKWLRTEVLCNWDHHTYSEASLGGHLHIIKYVLDDPNPCSWTDGRTVGNCCSNAALRGHLEVIKYVRERGCPWDEYTCINAAEGGHLDVLKYVRDGVVLELSSYYQSCYQWSSPYY